MHPGMAQSDKPRTLTNNVNRAYITDRPTDVRGQGASSIRLNEFTRQFFLRRPLIPLGCSAALAIAALGCAPKNKAIDEPAKQEMLRLLMPSKIKIVEPFTRVRSFDADSTPDGIEVLIQAVNSMGNSGLMVVGNMQIELYEHVSGSADQKGKRLEHWNIDISRPDDQKKYWNDLTQMYEFRLGVNPAVLPAAERFVLAATYNSPLGEHLTDEINIQRPPGLKPAELKQSALLPGTKGG